MESVLGMTKQGVRDLNGLGPKKKKLRADHTPQGEGSAETARGAERPVADTAPVAELPPA